MLFSIAPKKKKSDLFNRESEYRKLEKDVQTGRIILLDGLRRIGKTSLLKVFLNENDYFNIMIDCRAFEKIIELTRENLKQLFLKQLTNK